MIALAERKEGDWKPPIITTVGVNGAGDDGIAEVVTRLDAHWSWLTSTGELRRRRHARAREEITALVFATLRHRLAASNVEVLAGHVADGTLNPFDAAEELIAEHVRAR